MKASHPDEYDSKKGTPPADIFASRKHSMDYFTVDGVILRTRLSNKLDWYLLPIRELLDNDIDFLWKHYKGADNVSITVQVSLARDLFRLKVRNSNHKNIPVFSDLKYIFDYDMRYGSKQDVHIISRGMLGDAMKQILSLGYVLLHADDDGTSFTDKQWEYPLIIRRNKEEWKVYLHYDKSAQEPQISFEHSKKVTNTDTEIELALPVIEEVGINLNGNYIERFCRKYSIFTTDISFKFSIIDEIPSTIEMVLVDDMGNEIDTTSKYDSNISEKRVLNIDLPALHPIAADKEWTNSDSAHSYLPEEFKGRITNVHDKDSTSVYDVLCAFREGTNVKKTNENKIPILELLSDPDKDRKIEASYHQLRDALDPPKILSLPYTINTKKRAEGLIARLAKLYDIDDEKEPSYKLVRGFYRDKNGIVQYPYAFEILAIPLKNPTSAETEFIGAVNYSVSPKDNNFEGNYTWYNKYGTYCQGKNIFDVLHNNGFHKYNGMKSRLSCIIIGNLITPRRDPIGYDKSSIDTQPFASSIVTAINRMASGVQTYRAAGYRFQEADDYTTATKHEINRRVNARDLLKKFLIEERGLPRGMKKDE